MPVGPRKTRDSVCVGGNLRARSWPRVEFRAPVRYKIPPIRIYPDTTVGWGLASLAVSRELGAPLLLQAEADQVVNRLAFTTNKVSVSELFAAVATTFVHREKLRNRNLIVFRGNEAARGPN